MSNKKFWTSLLAGLMAVFMLLSLLLSILPHKASAKTSSEIKDQIGQIEEENKELENQLNTPIKVVRCCGNSLVAAVLGDETDEETIFRPYELKDEES